VSVDLGHDSRNPHHHDWRKRDPTALKKIVSCYPGEKRSFFSIECDRLKLGQRFISEGGCPEGFCAWAFADIQRDITHLRLGGDYPWMKQKGTILSCCTDGVRPVIFKLERIEE